LRQGRQLLKLEEEYVEEGEDGGGESSRRYASDREPEVLDEREASDGALVVE
jgi:hypothetical protein